MANIKFSQFTVGNVESDIDFVVGYKGGDNIQISPANLLSATLTGYLPLTGGTMTGNIKYNDSVRAQFGTGVNAEIQYTGSNFVMSNFTGDMIITNYTNDKDIIFQCDDGSGGVTQYFRIDGGYSSPYTIFPDNSTITLGSSLDLRIVHNGTDSFIDQTGSGNLYIRQKNDDKDIILESDDGSGGTTEYFRLDGNLASGGNVYTVFPDNSVLAFGNSQDFRIYHSGSNTFINNVSVGDVYFDQSANDKDIIFRCDDGAGGLQDYLIIDGSLEAVLAPDTIYLAAGTSLDLSLRHDGTNSHIQNNTGDLTIKNGSNDNDIIFQCDDGAGGLATYLYLDGSQGTTRFEKNARWQDGKLATFGDGDDLQIYHDGTNSVINNITNNLQIINNANDGDISFQSDDGSGGTAEYFKLDGSAVFTRFSKDVRFSDNVRAEFGNSGDLDIYHDGTTSNIVNNTGNLSIINQADNSDIKFFSDDGSGGVAEYFRVDGGSEKVIFSKGIDVLDNVRLRLGTSSDLQIYSDNSNNIFDFFNLSNVLFRQHFLDGDMTFQSDNGSGGITEYFRLDGGDEQIKVSKTLKFFDNIPAWFGDGNDLKIYHDGSNSYIDESGTGRLNIRSSGVTIGKYTGENGIIFNADAEVKLYYNNSAKLETTSTGIKITGVSEYADNTAAIAGGLTTGDVYRTGDLLKIVH